MLGPIRVDLPACHLRRTLVFVAATGPKAGQGTLALTLVCTADGWQKDQKKERGQRERQRGRSGDVGIECAYFARWAKQFD